MDCSGSQFMIIRLYAYFDLTTYRQLEALDKELQQLSNIKENVDAKVHLHFSCLYRNKIVIK